jgi:hypothetical protein
MENHFGVDPSPANKWDRIRVRALLRRAHWNSVTGLYRREYTPKTTKLTTKDFMKWVYRENRKRFALAVVDLCIRLDIVEA